MIDRPNFKSKVALKNNLGGAGQECALNLTSSSIHVSLSNPALPQAIPKIISPRTNADKKSIQLPSVRQIRFTEQEKVILLLGFIKVVYALIKGCLHKL